MSANAFLQNIIRWIRIKQEWNLSVSHRVIVVASTLEARWTVEVDEDKFPLGQEFDLTLSWGLEFGFTVWVDEVVVGSASVSMGQEWPETPG